MANLTIPGRFQAALDKLVRLNGAQISALISALESGGAKPTTLPPALIDSLKPLSVADIRQIMEFINSIYLVRAAQDIASDKFLATFVEPVQTAREQAQLQGEDGLSKN